MTEQELISEVMRESDPIVYWGIVETHNGQFDNVRAPYMSQDEAMDHRDRLREYRKRNPVPLTIEYRIVRVHHPSFIG